jgi:hypothetical protein
MVGPDVGDYGHDMRIIDRESGARVFVFTFKEGLLSAVAHDLKLRVDRFRVEVAADDSSVTAVFDPTSLRVVTAMKDGQENPAGLPPLLFSQIEKNIVDDVLRPTKYPEVRFASTRVDATGVDGVLTLCGHQRPVWVARRDEADGIVGRARLDQRAFGIKPFSAMMGTLKIQPHVDVEIHLPRP